MAGSPLVVVEIVAATAAQQVRASANGCPESGLLNPLGIRMAYRRV